MRVVWDDLRLAARACARRPGFTATVVATLALGIGGNVALFSVVDGVLLRPLPYPDPDRLVIVWENDRLRGTEREAVSAPDYLDLRETTRSFEATAARARLDRTLGTASEPVRVSSARVTASYFAILGVRPLLGRTFRPDEEEPGRDGVVLLTAGLWRDRFGADPGVVGRTVLLDGEPRTVVGVVPAEARLPGLGEEIFEPLAFAPQERNRGRHTLRMLGRLRADASLAAAQADVAAAMRGLEQAYPDDNRGRGAWVRPLVDEVVSDVRPALGLLFGAVALLLLMACASVANLVLARGVARARELAIRASLGAGPLRVFRQLLTENLLLALGGGALGVLLAGWAVGLARTLSGPADVPRLSAVALDGRALVFALAVSGLSALVFGALPALRGARRDPRSALAEGARVAATAGGLRTRRALVAFELATAVVLVVGAGLLVRSFWKLRAVDPGYDPRNVLLASVSLSGPGYEFPAGWPVHRWPAWESFSEALERRLAAVPGVASVAFAHQGPADPGWTTRVTVEGRPALAPGDQPEASYRPVSEGYFRALGIRLERGRDFGRFDGPHAPLVAVVNAAFAARHFPGEDPVGRRIVVFGAPREVVGVVGNERFAGLEAGPAEAMYLPIRQNPQPLVTLVVRALSDPLAVAPGLRAAVRDVDPALALFEVGTAEGALAASLAQRRFTLLLLGAFALVAVLLAVVGVYGVVSYAVGDRTREVGVRIALGAEPRHVFGLVVRQGMGLATAAVALGGLFALALGRVMERLLFGVDPRDPLTFGAVIAVLLAAAFLASAAPARRATRVDPIAALRAE